MNKLMENSFIYNLLRFMKIIKYVAVVMYTRLMLLHWIYEDL